MKAGISGLIVLALAAVLCAGGVGWGAEASINGDNTVPVDGTQRTVRSAPSRDIVTPDAERVLPRAPLGRTDSKGVGLGAMVASSYDDLQASGTENRRVATSEMGGLVDIHFVYGSLLTTDPSDVAQSGYNVYDATNGLWPQGAGVGCVLQPPGLRAGIWTGVATRADGLAVTSATDYEGEAGPAEFDHDIYYQNSQYFCIWTQSWIPYTTYSGSWLNPANRAAAPSIATQVIGTDTILHCVVGENGFQSVNGTTIGHHVISYFRKVGSAAGGVWSDQEVVDTTASWSYNVVAERGGSKVAVVYVNTSDSGWQENNGWDNDVFYRESTDGGMTWSSKVNVTDYAARRTAEITSSANPDLSACYDTDGFLHIVWTGQEVPVEPYRNGWSWDDFNADLFHWSANLGGPHAGGTITKVADGTYDPIDQPGFWNSRVCGFGPGLGQAYIDAPSIAFCSDRLYVIWNQMHSGIAMLPGPDTASAINDCAAAGAPYNANWEIFASVSVSPSGVLWNVPQNLTNTYTPGCTAGNCGNEFNPSMALAAVTDDEMALNWPTNEVDVWGTDWDKSLHIAYLDDETPGSWYNGDNATPSFNDIKWFRLPCGEPEGISCIPLYPFWNDADWPEYVVNGDPTEAVSVSIPNNCDFGLDVVEVQISEYSGSGWLDVATPVFTIPANSSYDLDVQITPPMAGSGMQFLNGELNLVFASGQPDVTFPVSLMAGDDVGPAVYDTVASSTAWDPKAIGDNIALTVSNFGEIGHSGVGEVNLDFVTDGNDCDLSKDVYLYAGSPFYMENTGGEILLTTSHYAGNRGPFHETESWKPLDVATESGHGDNGAVEYDSAYVGKCVNRDGSVAIERTFYAPRDNVTNPGFVVCETKLYSEDGLPHSSIAFGSVLDWDVPADDQSINVSGITSPTSPAGFVLYFQGTDTAGSTACESNEYRYAAEKLLGWYNTLDGEACEASDVIYGAMAVGARDYLDDAGTTDEPDAQQWWDSLGANPGYVSDPNPMDQAGFGTYVYDYELGGNDTLVFLTVTATQHNGTLDDFEAAIGDAGDWWYELVDCASVCPGSCGNVNGSADGLCTIADLTAMIDYLYMSGMAPDPLCVADIDGYPGITNNDLITMIDYIYVAHDMGILDCNSYIGDEFPQSFDVIELRNTIVPSEMVGTHTVEVWMDLWDEPAYGFTFPFHYETRTPAGAVTLTDIETFYDKDKGDVKFGEKSGDGLISFYSETDTLPRHVADLHFQINGGPHLEPVQIFFDTTTYPPSHTTVLSRLSDGGDTVRARGCYPHLRAVDDTVITPIGGAIVYNEGDTIVVERTGKADGEFGVRLPAAPNAFGCEMNLRDVDLSQDSAGMYFDIYARNESTKGLQRMSGCGIFQAQSGLLQVMADYTLIGDPNVTVRVYNGGVPTGWASVPGGGVIAIGYDYGPGIPQMQSIKFSLFGDPTFTAQFSNAVEYHLTDGPVLIGDRLELVSENYTTALTSFDRIDALGTHLVSFGLYNIDLNNCCAGMKGNYDCSVDDLVTMSDLTVLIDHLFITLSPLCCLEEGELDGTAPVTMGDLTVLIDHLFITLAPLAPCP